MTQEEIIEMARQAGYLDLSLTDRGMELKELEAFTKLVSAKEREECAKVCEELAELNRFSETDSMWEWGECAAAIRARGNV